MHLYGFVCVWVYVCLFLIVWVLLCAFVWVCVCLGVSLCVCDFVWVCVHTRAARERV